MSTALKYTGTKLFRLSNDAKPIEPGATIKDAKTAKAHGVTLDYLATRFDFEEIETKAARKGGKE